MIEYFCSDMYYFVYYFMYRFQRNKSDEISSRYLASAAVLITIVFQCFSILAAIRYFFDYKEKFFQFNADKQLNRLIQLLLLMVFLVITNFFFNKKKAEKIISNYDEKIDNIFSVKCIILFLLITVVPLLVGIYFVNHSVIVLDEN